MLVARLVIDVGDHLAIFSSAPETPHDLAARIGCLGKSAGDDQRRSTVQAGIDPIVDERLSQANLPACVTGG